MTTESGFPGDHDAPEHDAPEQFGGPETAERTGAQPSPDAGEPDQVPGRGGFGDPAAEQ